VTSLTADDTTSIPQLFRWEGDLNNLSKRFINRLQTRLQVLGYATGEIDGVMGPSTVSAIRTFQEKNGLTVNGRVSESWLPQLESELIKHTQSRLVDAGFDPGPVDGAMGGRTVTAINAFQKQMSLPQNGSVSDTLVAKLEEAIAARIAAQQAQEAAQKAREAEQQALQEELKASQRAEQTQLQMIQANLQALGFYSDKVDGQLGPATRQAIGKFQRKVKLKADGQPGDKVLERTNSEIVRTVQARLQVLGYQPGPADGAMGTRTRDAIRDFEGRTGMPVSGEATPVLVAKIQQVIDARLAEQQAQKTAPQTSPPAQQPAKSAEPPAPATAAAAVASTAETAAIDETDESYETDEAAETAETHESPALPPRTLRSPADSPHQTPPGFGPSSRAYNVGSYAKSC
jgi:peptidoglycan hydrolase-like protein with peptidoglycan-binding domain